MKKMKVVTALILTAILCIGLASCSLSFKKKNKDDETPSGERVEYPTIYYNPFDNYYTYSSDNTEAPEPVPVITTSALTTVNGVITHPSQPVTTQPGVTATTAPAATTTAPTTTAPTTAAHTTAAPTTAAPTTTAVPTTTAPAPLPDVEDSNFEIAVTEELNAERAANGLQPLTRSKDLSNAAKIRAREIATSFSHTRPDGSLWYTVILDVKGIGINDIKKDEDYGENIAMDYSSPEAVMDGWMESEGHKKNILTDNYKTVGTGCYHDSATDTYYWVQIFGT